MNKLKHKSDTNEAHKNETVNNSGQLFHGKKDEHDKNLNIVNFIHL